MPSLINELMLKEFRSFTSGVETLILVDASKLKSGESIKLRTDLRKIGAKLKISKGSLVQRALPEGASKSISFAGPMGVIAPGADVAAAAKMLADLIKEDKLALKGGLLEGRALNAKQASILAELPTREQASVMLVRTLQATLVQVVRVLKVASEPEGDSTPEVSA